MLASVPSPAVTATDTDAAAIAASLTQPHAFGVVFERHFGAIHRFLRARVGTGIAEELASETFVRAFGARAQYDASFEDARPWLFAIATNLIRGRRRAESRRLRAYAKLDPREALTPPEGDAAGRRLDAAARAPALGRVLRALSEADRDTLLLVAWADLSYEETARALDVPIGTVRSRLHRARAEVRAALLEEER